MYKFRGFAFNKFRSFDQEVAKIYPLRKMNFIIGQNNIGKSNIVKFMSEILPNIINEFDKKQKLIYSELDYNLDVKEAKKITIGFPLPLDEIDDFINSLIHSDWYGQKHYQPGGIIFEAFREFLVSDLFFDGNKTLWFNYNYELAQQTFISTLDINKALSLFNNKNRWVEMEAATDGNNVQRSGTTYQSAFNRILDKIRFHPRAMPEIVVVPAIRRVGDSQGIDINNGGDGIILQLAKLQNPELLRQEDREKFDKINLFVETVLESQGASIEIPFQRDMILVHMDGKVLPLDSLGTGIHEVIILAVTATVHTETIICIEEPELHLHPLLQRKLLKYLNDFTDNTYIFTSHSAHLLDAADAEIFHVSKMDDSLKVDSVHNNGQKTKICKDLGYKASDILQANCIIWVEGPSDRIYLNSWIKAKTQHLLEGIHYSIMFYGGRLLSHFTGKDIEEVCDFISLLSLNRNTIIVLDSDKPNKSAKINDTKNRIIKEVTENNGYAWLTKGREVENYLDADLVEQAVLAVHPIKVKGLVSKGIYDNILKYIPFRATKKSQENIADKVSVAKKYTELFQPQLNKLDLDKRIDEVIKYIESVN